MTDRTLTFPLDEFPLCIVLGAEGALINGEAEINYWPDGSWIVGHILVDGYDGGEKVSVALASGDPLDLIISQRLDNEWHSKVSDAVAAQIEIDREAAADDYADWRREARREFA